LLIECLGVDDAVRLIEITGGLKIWVPSGLGNSPSALMAQFEADYGPALTRKLIRYYGGGELEVPLAQKWRTEVYHQRGMSIEAIARKLQCSYITVRRRLGRSPWHSTFTPSTPLPPSLDIPADPV
jgi:hypothetical protein